MVCEKYFTTYLTHHTEFFFIVVGCPISSDNWKRRSIRIAIALPLLALLLVVMVIVPLVSAYEKNISINLTSPKERDVYFFQMQFLLI